EQVGVEVRLTPDMTRDATPEEKAETVRWCVAYRERGVVGLGLGAYEIDFPLDLYQDAFRQVHDEGLASVPHAGEIGGPELSRDALELRGADRLRHGFRAIEAPVLVDELADRRTVLDVCPISNVRTG